ncbi:hypothetical protein JTB14_036400 [Gonioctena quinquepunctata]|nr:hypothetical protein JTB14_036400 [Gonioctena quinquepunctata]
MVTNKIEYERKKYKNQVIQSGNPKRFYKHIRSSMSTKVGIPEIRKNNGSITNNQEVAQFFANSFLEAFTRKTPGSLPAMNHQPRNYESLTNIEFTPEIINLKLRHLDTN